jgi:hypothetical protein
MGEVYRATSTTLVSVNHPHIAAIYGLEKSAGLTPS